MAEKKEEQKKEVAPIIIIKRIKKVGGGHHGGAWKVAYADFVTAMMAFFLLMWLLIATYEKQKRGISNYFSPVGTTNSGQGSSGLFGGQTMKSTEGSLQDVSAPPVAGPNFGLNKDKEQSESDKEQQQKTDAALEKLIEERDKRNFEQVSGEIKEMVEHDTDLAKLKDNLVIDMTPDGLRIQIIDKDKLSMFPSGSAVMFDHTYRLLQGVRKIIQKFPNNITISGHTDAKPYKNDFDYTNWELSSDRANSTRRSLIDGGFPVERIKQVAGKADKEPFVKENPEDPSNRRISIILLHQKKKKGEAN